MFHLNSSFLPATPCSAELVLAVVLTAAITVALQRVARRLETDIATLAMAWLMAHPAGVIPVAGTNSLERIKTLGRATELSIDRETWFEIYTAALGAEVP